MCTGDTMQKPFNFTKSQSPTWNLQVKKKRRKLKNALSRRLEADIKIMNNTCHQLEKRAQERVS